MANSLKGCNNNECRQRLGMTEDPCKSGVTFLLMQLDSEKYTEIKANV